MNSKNVLATIAAAAALMSAPLSALAAPTFAAKITDGFNTVTIFDESVADSSSGETGVISFLDNNLFGNWTVSFVVGTSTFDPLGMHMSAGFSTSSSKFSTGESRTLTISLSQTGLSSGAGTSLVQFGANGGGSGLNSNSTWAAYADDADTLFGTGVTVASSTGYATVSDGIAASMTDLYSATLTATFDVTGKSGAMAGSQDLTMNVPEPGTIALAGLALLGLVGGTRRRQA